MNLAKGSAKLADGHLSLMERKLGNGDVRFSESYWHDFKFFLYQHHILLSIFCAHWENPNPRSARLIAFLAANVFAMFLAAVGDLMGDPWLVVYVVFVVVQTLFDLYAQYISSCQCCKREGVPCCIRACVLPLIGCLGGCCCLGLVLAAFIVVAIIFLIYDKDLGHVMISYVITKAISLVAGVFPIGFAVYNFKLRCHREVKDHQLEAGPGTGV